MKLSEILALLENQSKVLDSALISDPEIETLSLWYPSAPTFNNTLYFQVDTPGRIKQAPSNIVFAEPTVLSRKAKAGNWIELGEEEMSKAYHLVERALNNQGNTGDFSAITSLIIENRPLKMILAEVEKRYEVPLIALDITGKVLAASSTDRLNDPQLAGTMKQGWFAEEFMRHLKRQLETHELPNNKVILETTLSETTHVLFQGVYAETSLLGYVMMLNQEPHFDTACHNILPLISSLTAKVITRNNQNFDLNRYRYESLLTEMLESDDDLDMTDRVHSSGLEFPNVMAILMFRPQYHKDLSYLQTTLPELIAPILPKDQYLVSDSTLIYLVKLQDNAHFPKDVDEKLRAMIKKNKLRCSLSNAFYNPSYFKKYYLQAQKAMTYSDQLHQDRVINCYEDYCFYDLVSELPENLQLSFYIHSSLQILKKYDAKHDTDLYATLKALTLNNFNLSRTADVSYMHRNTLASKRTRIEALCGLDFTDPELSFKLNAAFILDEIQESRQ